MAVKIRRQCACGCGEVTNYGKRWLNGHNLKKKSEEHRRKMSLSKMGNIYGRGNKGRKQSEEHKLNKSLSQLKPHPDDEYCEVWRDEEYKKDIRKDYCENVNCKEDYKQLNNHHINLNKKDCRPFNIMTLCNSCHTALHRKLGRDINHKDYLTIIRKDRIVYIHKKTRKKVILRRVAKDTV